MVESKGIVRSGCRPDDPNGCFGERSGSVKNMKTGRFQILLMVLLLLVELFPGSGKSAETPPALAGGYFDASVTDAQVLSAAAFAIRTQEKTAQGKNNTPATQYVLVKILSVRQQVVAGMNYRLKLAVRVNSEEKQAEAVVYQKLSNAGYELTSWEWK